MSNEEIRIIANY